MRPTTQRIVSDSPFCEADAAMDRIKERLLSRETMGLRLNDVEQLVATEGRDLLRELLQAHLDLRSAQERAVEVTGSDGIGRRQQRTSQRRVETPVGEVVVTRQLYQAPTVEGLAPLDAALGLPAERYSYQVRRLVAEESSRMSFDEVVELLAKRTGAHVPKRQVEELTVRAAQDFDGFYADRLREAEVTDDLLILSFDGKGIAMRHEDLREATRKAAAATPRRLHTRLTSGEKPNRKRMAQVATVYTVAPWQRTPSDVLHTLRADRDVDEQRPRPVDKRVWASIEHSPQRVVDDAFDEARRRDPEQRRPWVVLVDGQRDQIARIKRAARKVGAEITIVLDIVHVIEYLWRAAYAFHDAGSEEAETWVRHRLLALVTGDSGGTVAKSIRMMAARRGLDDAARAAVDRCAGYLVKNTRWLNYHRALANGFPIATGVIEGACRYLVQDRMGRTGASWSLVGAEAILRLRALRTSGDFEAYWAYHLDQEHERNHRSRYAGGDIPNPLPKSRPTLRLVK